MMNQCDHSMFNGEGCIVVYDGKQCPLCALEKAQRSQDELGTISLSFQKLEDGTCNVFADIFSAISNGPNLVAEQAHFISVKPFTQDDDRHTLLNVPYETLKKFAKEILE